MKVKAEVPRVVIAAPASGSGKSTVAMGLMAALSRDHIVQGFKVGPDYIDPGYHTAATGRVSRNLDTWMVPPSRVKATFARAVSDADLAIIEGVMGLFDGYEAKSESGSTAEVAKLLRVPVILVLDVGKMARSAAAMALGYRNFDPQLDVAGIICNNVGSEHHALWVTEAIEAIGLPALGCIPWSEGLKIPERHLGLQTAIERSAELKKFLERASRLIARHIDLKRLWTIARQAPALEVNDLSSVPEAPSRVRLAVAHDAAFCFYYEDNFDLLRAAGAEIIFFSPLRDATLPTGISGLYLGGGYPELYAAQLAANGTMRSAIRAAIETGLPTYAECGGLMYLTQSITDLAGKTYPMAGVLPGRSHMRKQLVMGYRIVTAQRDSLLLRRGEQVRGHEFHYSDWVECMADHHYRTKPSLQRGEEPRLPGDNGPFRDAPWTKADFPYAYEIASRQEEEIRREGFARDKLLASYVHLHFAADPKLAVNFVNACLRWQQDTGLNSRAERAKPLHGWTKVRG
jgi:cobyrinic acid a,c-diamide synthase